MIPILHTNEANVDTTKLLEHVQNDLANDITVIDAEEMRSNQRERQDAARYVLFGSFLIQQKRERTTQEKNDTLHRLHALQHRTRIQQVERKQSVILRLVLKDGLDRRKPVLLPERLIIVHKLHNHLLHALAQTALKRNDAHPVQLGKEK